MAKIDDEERINEILTDRHNLLNGINDLMDESVESSESLLSVEENINEELVEENSNRQDIIDKIVEMIDYESARKDNLTLINENLKEEKQHRYEISESIDAISSSEEKRIETLDNVNKNIKEQISHFNSLNSALSSTTSSYQNIATAANNAAQQSNNTQIQSGGTNNANGIIDDEKEKTSKLSAALTNIYELLKKIAVEGFEKWVEIDDKVHKVGRSIGLNGKQARAMVDDITDSYSSMAQRLGMTFAEIFKFQEEYNKNIGRAIILTNDQVETMAGLSKLVGDVAVNDMVKNMDDFGASSELATDYLTQNMARAKVQGLDAKKTSEAFANNVKLASKYNFREGVNGISKMTLLSQKLKFNMDSIANAAEKFETVEGAIETSANLQMLGGSFAAQFGNPLEAMNMAMLDMEGFTNKIVDTFSGKAIFNRETGQAEMSAIDKRFLKEAAKQLGLNYEDAWNMATQSAKIKDVERSLKPSENFTEEQKALIANKSIFKDGKHQVTYYDDDNKQVNKSVDQLTADDLKFLTDEKTTEVAMADDVHQIRDMLRSYLGKNVKETKSNKEVWEGNKEEVRIGMSDFTDNFLGDMGFNPKNLFDYEYGGWVQTIFSTLITGLGVYVNKGVLDTLKGIGSAKPQVNKPIDTTTKNITKPQVNKPTDTTTKNITKPQVNKPIDTTTKNITKPKGSAKINAKSSIFKHGFKRAPGRALLKTFGKQGLKRLPGIGTALAVFDGVVEGANAISTYSQKKMEIENSNLSEKEKAIAKTEAKRERNKGVGGAAGGAVGTLVGAAKGAALGAALGPVGMLIGGAIGGAVGYFGGKAIGSAVGGAVTSEEKTEEEKKQEEKKQEEIKNNEVSYKNTVLAQIRDYNQLIYELLLNRYSMVSESTINHNSSFNQNLVDNVSKQLGINNNNYAYQNSNYQNSVVSNPNAYYNSSNTLFDNILLKDSYYNTNSSIISKPTVGEPTYINKNVGFNSPSYKDNLPINNKLDLNVSGTIKLTTDKGNNIDLDLNQLLNNNEFISQLTTLINNRMNINGNGLRPDKNSVKYLTNSYGRNELNGR